MHLRRTDRIDRSWKRERPFAFLQNEAVRCTDPLVVSTFIEVFDEIAPIAIRAGQLAKSIMVFTDDRPAPQARTSKALLASASMKMVLAEMRNSVVHADSMDAAIVKAFGYIRQLTPSRVSAISGPNGIATRFDAHNRPEIRRIY